MCLAISKPAGIHISEEALKNGWANNNDGCGLCYVKDGELFILKGMWSWEELFAKYNQFKDLPMLIHFRIGTRGAKDERNCHPFSILDQKYALIHNGTLDIKCVEAQFSDTYHYAFQVIQPLLEMGIPIDNPSFKFLLSQAIGSNKMCIMDAQGKVVIYNDDAGHYVNGAWFSNYSYKFNIEEKRREAKMKKKQRLASTQQQQPPCSVEPSNIIIDVEIVATPLDSDNLQNQNGLYAEKYDESTEREIRFAMHHFRYSREHAIRFLVTNKLIKPQNVLVEKIA